MCKQLWHNNSLAFQHMHLSNIISKSLLYIKKEKKKMMECYCQLAFLAEMSCFFLSDSHQKTF